MKNADYKHIQPSYIKHNDFRQKTYINAQHWSDPNPLLRAGAGLGNTFNPIKNKTTYGEGGVCFPLSAAYLMCQHWEEFKSYIETPRGKGFIRGIKNGQVQARTFTGEKSGLIHEVLFNAMGNVGVNLDKRFHRMMGLDSQGIARRIYDCMRFETHGMLSIHSESSGHSMAIKIDSGVMKFFDPNNGEFHLRFDRNNRYSSEGFLVKYLARYYKKYNSIAIDCFKNGTLF